MKEQNRVRLEYPCMKFEYPEILRPEELDRYLAMGWFRMRQSVFTCDILLKEYSVHNTVWIRTPLEGYNFSKSLRKLMRRNNRRFSSTLTPFFISQEMEELYQRYRDGFKELLIRADGNQHDVGFVKAEACIEIAERFVEREV